MPTGLEIIELSRWQGGIDRAMQEQGRQLDRVSEGLRDLSREVKETRIELAMVKTKISFYSTLGAIVGAGAVTWLGDKI